MIKRRLDSVKLSEVFTFVRASDRSHCGLGKRGLFNRFRVGLDLLQVLVAGDRLNLMRRASSFSKASARGLAHPMGGTVRGQSCLMGSLTKPVRESLVRARLAKGRENESWSVIRRAIHYRL